MVAGVTAVFFEVALTAIVPVRIACYVSESMLKMLSLSVFRFPSTVTGLLQDGH